MPSRLYRLAHDAILSVLAECFVDAPLVERRLNGGGAALRLRGEVAPLDPPSSIFDPRTASPDPFLCFGRGDPNDVVLGAHKIMGSAQRRRRGAVLQHGSLLLRASSYAVEYPGLCDLAGLDARPDRLAEQVGSRIAATLGDEWVSGALTAGEEELAARLSHEKYSHLTWSGAESTCSKTSELQTT
jgi:lipoate-protein ligase A